MDPNILLPIQKIDIADFNYDLPDRLIARHPLARRDQCRLLVVKPDREHADSDALIGLLGDEPSLSHRRFDEIVDLLPDNALIVRNDTKVINARLHFKKPSGAAIEVFLLEPFEPADYALNFQSVYTTTWKCMVGNLKKWKEGELKATATLSDGRQVTVYAERQGEAGNAQLVRFGWATAVPFSEIVEALGNIPIPPYLNRESEESDLTDYQTVYAKDQGSVAAPTAGLHFTDELFKRLAEKKPNITVADVTLHVGAGTFRPVKSKTLGGHFMHEEPFIITRSLVERLIDAQESERLVVAVGTTTVRTLESLPYIGTILDFRQHGEGDPDPNAPLHVEQWDPYDPEFPVIPTLEALRAIITEMNLRNTDTLSATTDILIGPGHRWQIVEAMITNFHQPESTLLLLVSSFLGLTPEDVGSPDALWRQVYREAVEKEYRFLSYGDACLFFRHSVPTFHRLNVPGSKSISNRALVLNALSDPKADLENLSDSTDTRYLEAFIRHITHCLSDEAKEKPVVTDFFIGDGAAPLRFAVALASVIPGLKVNIFPSQRLMERLKATSPTLFNKTPLKISPRRFAISKLNLDPEIKERLYRHYSSVRGQGNTLGYQVTGRDFSGAEPIELEAKEFCTSQEPSALLLVSGKLPPLKLTHLMALPSLPYLLMTQTVCKAFGLWTKITWDKTTGLPQSLETRPGATRAPEIYFIEPDWSAMLNFYAFSVAARYAERERTVALASVDAPEPEHSIQPDSRMVAILADMLPKPYGKPNKKLVLNLMHSPDAVPPLVAAALCSNTKFEFSGLFMLAAKESDRLEAIEEEFGKLGWKLWRPEPKVMGRLIYKGSGRRKKREENPLLDSHNDHRIAMALAATLPITRRFRLLNPFCVSKSFPYFWDELEAFGVNFDYDPETDIAQLEF